MRKYLRVGLLAAALLSLDSPIRGDNCYECLYGDLCVPVPLGWGYDSCKEVTKVVPCGVVGGVPINCVIETCDVGAECTIPWDLA